MNKVTVNEFSTYLTNSHTCIQISTCGPVDKLWMPFIHLSVIHMFLCMAIMSVIFIILSAD